MRKIDFRGLLRTRQKAIDSVVCIGLDPLIEKIPRSICSVERAGWQEVSKWMIQIVEATASYTSMFKPNRAFYEAFPDGDKALRAIICHINRCYPDIPVFLDCKRGDIGSTQAQYRKAHFEIDGADGMNYNGYMGRSTLTALVDVNYCGRALVGLGRTSNPDAWEIQDAWMSNNKKRVWEHMVEKQFQWSKELGVLGSAGIVMGAAMEVDGKPNALHLRRARQIVGDQMWFLIPGFGTQGGCIEATITESFMGPGSIACNSSSGIIFASSDKDYADAAGDKAQEFCRKIREAGANCSQFSI